MLYLLLATLIWGMGFVATRWTFIDYTPLWSHALRFLLAGGISIIILAYRRPKNILLPAMICSLALSAGLGLQTIGIAHTSLAKSGFLTALYALFTPMFCYLFYKAHFRKAYWALLCLALIGILFLFEFKIDSFNKGDLLVIMSAVAFALHIMAVDKYGQIHNSFDFNMVQSVWIAIFCIPVAYIFDGGTTLLPLIKFEDLFVPSALSGLILLSVFSSLIAFSLQNVAQKTLPPHTASLIFLMESVFASIFGYFFFSETLTSIQAIGCALILFAISLVPRFVVIDKREMDI